MGVCVHIPEKVSYTISTQRRITFGRESTDKDGKEQRGKRMPQFSIEKGMLAVENVPP